jgi:hypothetical protein
MANEKEQEPFIMSEVYAFVTQDQEGNEGVVTIINPHGQMQPLISFDDSQLDLMKGAAQQIADETKQDIQMIKFTTREGLDTFEPRVVQLAQPGDVPRG